MTDRDEHESMIGSSYRADRADFGALASHPGRVPVEKPPHYFPGCPFYSGPRAPAPADNLDLADQGVELAQNLAIENREKGRPVIKGRTR